MHKISIPGVDLLTSPRWWQRLVHYVKSTESCLPSGYVEKNFNARCVFDRNGDISYFEFKNSEDAAIFVLTWGSGDV